MKKAVLIVVGTLLLVLAIGTLVTTPMLVWMMPNIYAAETQIAVTNVSDSRIDAEILRIRSSEMCGQVITNLNLANVWKMKYKLQIDLALPRTESILQDGLKVKRVGHTQVISIRFKSDDREEAARIANEVARVYLRSSKPAVARLLRPATQATPAQASKLRIIAVAAMIALALGGTGVFLITAGLRSRRAG